MTDLADLTAAFKRHYTQVCRCEWREDEFTRETTSENCVMHGSVPDPLAELLAQGERDRQRIRELTEALRERDERLHRIHMFIDGLELRGIGNIATEDVREGIARAALAGEEDAPARVQPNETREIVYEYRGVALPERIAVDQAGTYWRDFGPFLSLVPHKDGNENATIVAEYRLTVTPEMKLRAAGEEATP